MIDSLEIICGHYWKIAPASENSKRTSTGVCQKCGAVREYQNYIDYDPTQTILNVKNAEDTLPVTAELAATRKGRGMVARGKAIRTRTLERIAVAKQLQADGLRGDEIAGVMGVSEASVSNYLKADLQQQDHSI